MKYEGRNIYYDHKGYALVCIDGVDCKVHILVWEKVNGKKPKGCDIHHIDEDKGNFKLENLQLLTHSHHQRIHAGWIMKNGNWLAKPCVSCKQILPISNFYKRKGYTPTPNCKKCHCKKTFEWSKRNPEKRKRIGLAYYYRSKSAGGKTNAWE